MGLKVEDFACPCHNTQEVAISPRECFEATAVPRPQGTGTMNPGQLLSSVKQSADKSFLEPVWRDSIRPRDVLRAIQRDDDAVLSIGGRMMTNQHQMD